MAARNALESTAGRRNSSFASAPTSTEMHTLCWKDDWDGKADGKSDDVRYQDPVYRIWMEAEIWWFCKSRRSRT